MPGVTLRHVLVHEDPLVRGSLDFQGRSCHSPASKHGLVEPFRSLLGYVLVLAESARGGEVLRRQAELTDEELVALWRGAVALLEKHGGFAGALNSS